MYWCFQQRYWIDIISNSLGLLSYYTVKSVSYLLVIWDDFLSQKIISVTFLLYFVINTNIYLIYWQENEFKWIPRRRAMTLYNIENGSSEKSEEITALTNSLNKTVKAMDTLNESYQKLSKLVSYNFFFRIFIVIIKQ